MDDVEEEPDMSEKEKDNKSRSIVALLLSKNKNDDLVEEEYQPEAGEAVDDETTIEAEEKLVREMSYEEEIAMLKRENEMSLEDLRAMYAGMDRASEAPHSDTSPDQSSGFAAELEKAVGNEENDDEFVPQSEEKDDETTMEAEEWLGREMNVEDELRLLKSEGELPIEQLRSMCCLGEESGTADSTGPSQHRRKREDDAFELRQRKLPWPDEPARDAGKEALDALEASAEKAWQTRASRPFILSPWVRIPANGSQLASINANPASKRYPCR